ncbi:MAG: cation diffusion facilitator family transporter, partial [Acidobacteriota bacterium]
MENRSALSKFAWLSIAAAVLTIGLKSAAFGVTGSVGLLSDALESGANLATALLALLVLRIVARPPDQEHAHGHEKAEYFSSGVEGAAILIAAGMIGFVGIRRLFQPQPLVQLNVGLLMTLLATFVNFTCARILFKVSRTTRSIVLEAQARHLMVDVWTSGGVILGIGAVVLTGWQFLDPVIAVGVGLHVTWVGLRLVRRSILGLMDTSLPESEIETVRTILEGYAVRGIRYHALRTRQSGIRAFVSVHIQVPGEWSVQKGHDLLEEVEG